MKRIVALLFAVGLLFGFDMGSSDAQIDAFWRGEFFANSIFAEPAVSDGVFGEIAFNWEDGSPNSDVPVDNFTARFGADVVLPGGDYRFYALADDYVIITIDFQYKVIDTFEQDKADEIVTGDITLGPGSHHIQVDYRENGGDAYLYVGFGEVGDFSLPSAAGLLNIPLFDYGGITATVRANRLNVRNVPSETNSDIITKVTFGQVYPVVAQTPQGDWVQINVNGLIGWVSAPFVSLRSGVVADPGGFTVSALGSNVNVRSGPGVRFNDLGNLPAGRSAVLIGRTADNTWWQINYNGLVGWVTSQYTSLAANVDVNAVPITG